MGARGVTQGTGQDMRKLPERGGERMPQAGMQGVQTCTRATLWALPPDDTTKKHRWSPETGASRPGAVGRLQGGWAWKLGRTSGWEGSMAAGVGRTKSHRIN